MANFTGTLNSNEIFSAIYNMIISQQVFADNVKGTYSALVEKAKVDGSMYGDTKLFYATDALASHEWGADAEAGNLLAIDRPEAPKVQAITIDTFRQIRLTVDNYMSKRAFSTEGAFQSFNDVMKGWIRDTKRIYDSTLYNSYIGSTETDAGKQSMTITPVAGQNDALTMAEALATLLVELKDVSRDFNDYGYIRSYDEGDLVVVWNAKHYNTLKKIDMPTIFHTEGLLDEFKQEVLPARYFGKPIDENPDGDVVPPSIGGKTVRAAREVFYTASGKTAHLFPGDLVDLDTYEAGLKYGDIYEEDDSIAFKVMHKDSVPYMSGFEVGTSFFNPRSLTENNYLTFGHNTLEYLKDKPFITARFNEA